MFFLDFLHDCEGRLMGNVHALIVLLSQSIIAEWCLKVFLFN